MDNHYTYLGTVIQDPNWQKFITALGLCLVFLLLGYKLPKLFKENIKNHIIPSKKFSIPAFFDFIIERFVKYHDTILGKAGRRFVPFTGSIFFFLLFSNILGLVPGMAAITTSVWINVGLALLVFIYFNYLGLKNYGLKGYLAHFCGPSGLELYLAIPLAFLLFPIEIFSTCLRILTLNLRLYWNITADHLVLNIFTNDIGPLIPIIKSVGVFWVYGLGFFVSFMQAFIFTTLTMVYILLATQTEEH